MARPKQNINNQKHEPHKGHCKICGHLTKARIVIGPTQLNPQYQGKEINICTPCKKKKHAGKNFGRVAIEVLGMSDWSQPVNNTKLGRRMRTKGG